MRGFFTAIMAAAFFGLGFVVRKWGLSYLPSALTGAFFGACTALSMIVLASAVRGRFERLVEDNLWQIPWWFVAGEIATSIALFLQFSAFDYLPAWSSPPAGNASGMDPAVGVAVLEVGRADRT